VMQITEVQRMESDVVTLQDVYQFKIDSVAEDRRVTGSLQPTGLRPSFISKFEKHGIDLPIEMFQVAAGHLAPTPAQVARASR
jgi:pilus assembly protein CpaF